MSALLRKMKKLTTVLPATPGTFSDKFTSGFTNETIQTITNDGFTNEPVVQCDVQVVENTFVDNFK